MEELENGVTESVADSEPNLEETAVEETTQQVEEPAAEEPAKEPEIPDSVWAIARKRSVLDSTKTQPQARTLRHWMITLLQWMPRRNRAARKPSTV